MINPALSVFIKSDKLKLDIKNLKILFKEIYVSLGI